MIWIAKPRPFAPSTNQVACAVGAIDAPLILHELSQMYWVLGFGSRLRKHWGLNYWVLLGFGSRFSWIINHYMIHRLLVTRSLKMTHHWQPPWPPPWWSPAEALGAPGAILLLSRTSLPSQNLGFWWDGPDHASTQSQENSGMRSL
jgi:hypothetical protein